MDIVLPYDESLEDSILGQIIMEPDLYDEVAPFITDLEVFYHTKARALWLKISNMRKSREHIDVVTLCSEITKNESNKGLTKFYITYCIKDLGLSGNIKMYATKLYEKYLMRKVIVATYNIQGKARDNNPEVYHVINNAHTLLGELLNVRPSSRQDIDEVIAETVESMKQDKSLLISTGYESLDRFAGGLTRGEITIVGGRPGHGKTTMLINMMSRILAGNYQMLNY